MFDILIYVLLAFAAVPILIGGFYGLKTRGLARQAEMLAPPIGRRFEVEPGGALHLFQAGEGPPIVLIHGAGGTLRHFTATILDDLARDNLVVAMDRPAAGYSVRPKGATGGLEDQAAFLLEGIAKLGLERPLIVGHSMGGAVAATMALRAPERIAGLVLLAPAVRPFRAKPPLRDAVIESPAARALLANTVAAPMALAMRDKISSAIFAPQEVPGDFPTTGGGLLGLRPSHIRGLMDDLVTFQADLGALQRRLPEITAPVRAIFGANDGVFDPKPQAEALRTIPQAEVEIWNGVGHMVQFAEPTRTAEAIRAARRAADA